MTLFAFLAVYLLWGSNYLAMKIGVESIPPLMLAGVRSLIGGLLLFGWGIWRGGAGPTRREWGIASVIGGCMFLGAHGGLFWAIQRVPSGVASLFVATVPIWMTLSQRLTEPHHHIGPRTIAGIAGGALGLVVLVGPGQFMTGQAIDPIGAVVLIGVALLWTTGSTIARRTAPPSISVATGSYLLAGGSMLVVVSGLAGEFPLLATHPVSGRSIAALAYLIVCGSLIAFSAYNYLLRRSTLAKVSTYAYVNPLVAIALGWAFGGETLDARVGIAAALIIGSVALSLTAAGTGHRGIANQQSGNR
ncbi:MAG: EamA family transporter [Vicinamibacterales bacterium]